MSRGWVTLAQAAERLQLDASELRHAAQRGEVDATQVAGDWRFPEDALDEWAQRHLLASRAGSIAARHEALGRRLEKSRGECGDIASLMPEVAIDIALEAKAKAGIVRDMTDLADRTGLVYDPEFLFRELMEREAAASTAIGAGVAFLHPRRLDPYAFERSFIAYGRSARPIFFGAPDGAATRHFFLICCTGRDRHLHSLARLAVLAHGSSLVSRLDEASSPADVLAAIISCEAEFAK